jgi:ribosomal protein S27AE
VGSLQDEAVRLLNAAVRSGDVKPPEACENCGVEGVQAHHPDYSRPFYVRWLCLDCHGAEHGRRQGGRPRFTDPFIAPVCGGCGDFVDGPRCPVCGARTQ